MLFSTSANTRKGEWSEISASSQDQPEKAMGMLEGQAVIQTAGLGRQETGWLGI